MTAPSVAYGQLAPMLIVFGVAVVGVLVEAFLPRKLRYRAQLSLSLAGLFVALIWVLRVTLQLRGGIGNSVVAGAVDIDRPTLFLWATILMIGVLSVPAPSGDTDKSTAVPVDMPGRSSVAIQCPSLPVRLRR